MRYVLKCKYCYKTFTSKSANKKYCCKTCKTNAYKEKRDSMSQICWRCKNACGGCSWSHNLTPVNGWKATKIIRKTEIFDSYDIEYCPEFIFG